MPESPCSRCGETCKHTDDDPEPLCPTCTEGLIWTRLILDVANGVIKVPPDFRYQKGGAPEIE